MKSSERRVISVSTSSMLVVAAGSMPGCGGKGPPSAMVCLPTLPQAGMLGRIVYVGCLGVQNVSWTEAGVELGILGIFGVVRLLHGVEVVQDAVELVETVNGGQVFVAVAQVVLADLRRRVAKRPEQLGDGRVGVLDALLGRGHANFQQSCAERTLAGDERRASRCERLLAVVVGEQGTFAGDPVDIRGGPAHHPAVIRTEVPRAHVIGHDHDAVRLLTHHRARSSDQMIGRMVWARR
jgi:hypothetical protein